MQNIYEILGSIGIDIPEDKKADLNKALSKNYKTIAEVEKIENTRDLYKEQLSTAQEALKSFEGVDVSEMRGKISSLEATLQNKEAEFAAKMADRDFTDELNNALREAGARNSKSVIANLDVDALKASKNRSQDIANAIEKCKAENDFLFADAQPQARITGNVGSASMPNTDLKAAANAALRSIATKD